MSIEFGGWLTWTHQLPGWSRLAWFDAMLSLQSQAADHSLMLIVISITRFPPQRIFIEFCW